MNCRMVMAVGMMVSVIASNGFTQNGPPGGGMGKMSPPVMGEVVSIDKDGVLVKGHAGDEQVSFGERTRFMKEDKVARIEFQVGDILILSGQGLEEGDAMAPESILLRDRNAPKPPANRPAMPAGRMPRAEVEVVNLAPLEVKTQAGVVKPLSITPETRQMVEAPAVLADIVVGDRVRVICPPLPGTEKKTAALVVKLMLPGKPMGMGPAGEGKPPVPPAGVSMTETDTPPTPPAEVTIDTTTDVTTTTVPADAAAVKE